MFNDNQFSSIYLNIPGTDSLTKIFRGSNQLEEHIGRFGSGLTGKSKTLNAMINRYYIKRRYRKNKVCKKIDVLMNNGRGFFKYQIVENNFGMMFNIEGT